MNFYKIQKKQLRFTDTYDIIIVNLCDFKEESDFMFGYVSINKAKLTEEEYEAFTSYYCGVCKATGDVATHTARLGLSYDITFLALLLGSVFCEGEEREIRCPVHPQKKRKCRFNDRVVDYAAGVGVMLSYLKLADDWHDEKSIKALMGMAVFRRGYKKVLKELPYEYEIISRQLRELSRLEKEKSNSPDDVAEAFGKILEALFAPHFVEDIALRRKLQWLGLNLGRWIYLIDAVNDLETDIKKRNYNPFIEMGYKTKDECVGDTELSLTLNLEGVASAFELIDFKGNMSLIGKIIYIGLKEKQQLILRGQGKDNK